MQHRSALVCLLMSGIYIFIQTTPSSSCDEALCRLILSRCFSLSAYHLLSYKTQALILSSGTFLAALSPSACGAAACGLAAQPVQCIPPCNKLLVQSPGPAAVGYWLARPQQESHTKRLCVSQALGPPWEEARQRCEWVTRSVPRQQGAHLFHRKLGFQHRCA